MRNIWTVTEWWESILLFCFMSLLYTATQKASWETPPLLAKPPHKSATSCSTEGDAWQDRVAHYAPTTSFSQQTEHLWELLTLNIFVCFISTFFFCLPFFSVNGKRQMWWTGFTDVPYYSLKTVKILGWCLNIKQQKSFYNSLRVEAFLFLSVFSFFSLS